MNALIQKFHKTHPKASNLSKEECELVCSSAFRMIKETIEAGIFTNIRLKYFGLIQVSKPRIIYAKKQASANLEKGLITKEMYDKKMEILNKYKEKNEEKDK